MKYYVINNYYVFNIAIGFFGIAVSIVGIMTSIIASRINNYVKRYFIVIFFMLLLYVFCNLWGIVLRGKIGAGYRMAIYLANFGEFFFSAILSYVASRYLIDLSIDDPGLKNRLVITTSILIILHTILLVISQFTGLFYRINELNVYVRSPLYPLSYLFPGIILIIDTVVLLKRRNVLSTKQKVAFWVFLVFPIIAIILQILIYGVYFIVMATSFAGIAMFVLIVVDQTERYFSSQMENAEIRSALLLGQISPHFIFNSLMSIQDLCYSKPEEAADSIGHFASYLRHNIEDLTAKKMVSFERELDFIKEYIKVEKTDPDRDFDVEYDLKVTDFSIPTLTIQPVVENAVNYGALTCRNIRGKVVIYTYLEGNDIVIRVWNNKEGRRSTTEGQKKHRGIAIENISDRLKYYCNGTFELNVEEEETNAIIRMPIDEVMEVRNG